MECPGSNAMVLILKALIKVLPMYCKHKSTLLHVLAFIMYSSNKQALRVRNDQLN